MARHRRYDLDFKRRLAQEYLSGGVTLGALARHHDVSRNLVRLWVEKYEAGEFEDGEVQTEQLSHCQTRIAELERKVGQLVMENEWLKKTRRAAVQHSTGSTCVVSGPAVSPSDEVVSS